MNPSQLCVEVESTSFTCSERSLTVIKMSSSELRRHQAAPTFVGPEDPWYGVRLGTFPMPNRRPPGKRRGIPLPETLYQPTWRCSAQTNQDAISQTSDCKPSGQAAASGKSPSISDISSTQGRVATLKSPKRRHKEECTFIDPSEFDSCFLGSELGASNASARQLGSDGLARTKANSVPGVNSRSDTNTSPSATVPGTSELQPSFTAESGVLLPTESTVAHPGEHHLEKADRISRGATRAQKCQSDQPLPLVSNHITPPSRKRTRRTIEISTSCVICHKPLLRVIVRSSPHNPTPADIECQAQCCTCYQSSSECALFEDSAGEETTTVEQRKLLRVTWEVEDEMRKVVDRRLFCDVCRRRIAYGRISSKSSSASLIRDSEIICVSCDRKYQRCTNCGGGGGTRIGIGKWRLKELFTPGRKNCTLSHKRHGSRRREVAVHTIPTDFSPDTLGNVLNRCRDLWRTEILTQWAVPEMLEVESPNSESDSVQDYNQIHRAISRGWPSREAMIRADGVDSNRFRRLLCLVWEYPKSDRITKKRLRQNIHATRQDHDRSLEPTGQQILSESAITPPGCDLIGVTVGEWNIEAGSLFVSTLVSFRGENDDGSIATCAQAMLAKIQTVRQTEQQRTSAEPQLSTEAARFIRPCEHLWVISNDSTLPTRERMTDALARKRGFIPLDLYLFQHPEFVSTVTARPDGFFSQLETAGGGGSGAHGRSGAPPTVQPFILARWLGNDLEI